MAGSRLYEDRKWELQLLNAIRFANRATSNRLRLYSADGVDVTHQPKLERSLQGVQLENGNYEHEVIFHPC